MRLEHIDPHTTAILVIDMQADFLEPTSGVCVESGYQFLPKMPAFLDACRDKGATIIYSKNVIRPDQRDIGKAGEFCEPIKAGTMCVDGAPGAEISPVIAPKPGDIVLKKSKYSFFYGTDLLNILTTIGIKTVICTGVCTDCCVFSTARDAGQYNFDVGLLFDFTGTVAYSDPRFGTFSAEEVKNCFLATMAISTADIMTSGELLSRFV